MSKQLFDYQLNFFTNIRKFVGQYKRVIAQLPTGGGKTICFVSIAKAAVAKGNTVLILSESTKIFEQISKEIGATEIKAGAQEMYIRKGAVYLAMAQTLVRREKMIKNFDHLAENLLVITDEAHLGNFSKILLQLQKCYLIGMTATPNFKDAPHLPVLYNALVEGPSVDDLIQRERLTPYRHFARVVADTSMLKIKAGEFTEESQEKVFETRVVYDGLMQDLKNVPFKSCMIFTASIKHCIDVYEKLQAAGYKAVQYHSKISKEEQSYSMMQFKTGAVPICVSVGALVKGFDHPPVDLAILLRATTSLSLYLQICGRASRVAPGKNSFTVLDYGGNYQRHGLWDAERDWSSMWQEQPKRKKAPSAAPVKLCPECEYINPVSAITCKNCGHTFQKSKQQQEEETRLVEINAAYRAMVGRKISDLSPTELAVYARLKNKKGHAARVAKAQEQKQPGFLQAYCQAIGYKAGWAHHQVKQLSTDPIEFFDTVLK